MECSLKNKNKQLKISKSVGGDVDVAQAKRTSVAIVKIT